MRRDDFEIAGAVAIGAAVAFIIAFVLLQVMT